jgi:hypothetical protein
VYSDARLFGQIQSDALTHKKVQILPHLAARQERPEMPPYLYFCTTSVFVLFYYVKKYKYCRIWRRGKNAPKCLRICTFILRQYLYFCSTSACVLLYDRQYLHVCSVSVFVLVYYLSICTFVLRQAALLRRLRQRVSICTSVLRTFVQRQAALLLTSALCKGMLACSDNICDKAVVKQ